MLKIRVLKMLHDFKHWIINRLMFDLVNIDLFLSSTSLNSQRLIEYQSLEMWEN